MTPPSKTFVLAVFAAALALPGFAQEAPTDTTPMTCAEFVTLDSTAMAEAISALSVKPGSADAGTTTNGTSGDMISDLDTKERADATVVACQGNPDMPIADVTITNP